MERKAELISNEVVSLWQHEIRHTRPRLAAGLALLTEPKAVLAVLQLAETTLAKLTSDVRHPLTLRDIPPQELVYFWTSFLRERYLENPVREPVDVQADAQEIARRVASSLFTTNRVSARWRNFVRNGPPPGVQEHPAYAPAERGATFRPQWGLYQNEAQTRRFKDFQSCVQPRRKQSLRSTGRCAPSDIRYPWAYT
jgi:hypothetical protein